MEEVSNEIFTFLSANSTFSLMMNDTLGLTKLFPIVADDSVTFPFSTYRIGSKIGQSKDFKNISVQLYFWFKPNEYQKCVAFTDAMETIIEEEYDWTSSSIEFLEENQSFAGIINFNR